MITDAASLDPDVNMKSLASLGVAALIAAAGVLWFMTNPTIVTIKVVPLKPSSELPTFKPVR
jgi:hypothetical protein